MLAATKVKMSSSVKKSKKEHMRHFLHKTCNQKVSGSFTLQSCIKTAKNYTKKKICFTCRVRITRILYTYNSNSDRSDKIPLYNSNYVPFSFDMTPPFSHFYSVTSNSNLNFTENLFSQRDIETRTRDFRLCFLPTCLNAPRMGVKNRRLIKQINLGLLVFWRILTLG